MEIKTIGIASDHAAFPLKQFVKQYLEEKGIPYKDYGTYTPDSCNYATYGHALAEGIEKGEVYPCFCTRADLHVASAPHRGEKLVYAGTCRDLSEAEVRRRSQERAPAWRLQVPDSVYSIDDLVQGTFSQNLLHDCGDFIVRRSDGLFAYQLAVVVDDAEQGVNCVVRGMDLLVSTPQQMYLQDLIGAGRCEYAHVPLIVGERDRRLSKRDRDAGIEELCTRFGSAAGVIGHIAWLVGLQECDEPVTPEQLLEGFRIPDFPDKVQIQWM